MAFTKHSQRTVRKPCDKCGSKDLYWAHDSEGKAGAHYCSEHGSANFTLINLDGSRHDCQGKYAATGEVQAQAYEPEPEPATVDPTPTAPVTAPTAQPATDDRMGALAALLDLLAPKVDASQVHAIVDARLAGLVLPVRVEVTRNGETKPVEGLAHKMLPTIIKIINIGKHVLMVGPAGTGKSHIGHQAAEALGLPFYSMSVGPTMTESRIVGYMDANGNYQGTLFRQAFEHGGVYLFDEVDNGSASVLNVINAALANGMMAFPDGMVKRHPDFRCIAAANTYGTGPDRSYVGRQALDAAFRNRFVMVPIAVDEALEESLCMATGLDGTKIRTVLKYCRYLRANIEAYKLPVVVGPRNSEHVCALLTAGLTVSEAIEYAVRCGMSDTDWRKISDGAPSI